MKNMAALKLLKVIGILMIIMTAGVWFFFSDENREVYVAMNEDIQFEELRRELGESPEYLATTSVRMKNVPDNRDGSYQVKIKVQVYEDAGLKKEISTNVQYELEDDVVVENGIQNIRVKLKIIDQALAQESIHMVMSAVLEKSADIL